MTDKPRATPIEQPLTTGTPRYMLPDSGSPFSGWKDYDRSVLSSDLSRRDKVIYLDRRLDLIFFNCFDQIYLKVAPQHKAVNGPEMSFFMVGTATICAVIEALGSFILGAGSDDERGINKKRFKAFLARYMRSWSGGAPKGTDVPQWLWENLRNGLVHGLTIEKGGLEDLGSVGWREAERDRLEVHAELLYQDLKSGRSAYFSDLTAGKDTGLCDAFDARFKEIFQAF